MMQFEPPTRIYGVDFSADKSDAGRNTWIAKGEVRNDRLNIECLSNASEMFGCPPTRDDTLAALLEEVFVPGDELTAIGLDVPFGLPTDMLGDLTWSEFIEGVDDRWGVLEDITDPVSLYESARRRADRHGASLRRTTDEDRKGQEPTGYRIKTQTFYGISALLANLPDDVSILPMDDPTTDTLILETYPAATFRKLRDQNNDGEVYDTGYKRDTRPSIEHRKANVRALSATGVDFQSHCEFAIASDDALDAVAAAYATWKASEDGTLYGDIVDDNGDINSPYDVEGYIFA